MSLQVATLNQWRMWCCWCFTKMKMMRSNNDRPPKMISADAAERKNRAIKVAKNNSRLERETESEKSRSSTFVNVQEITTSIEKRKRTWSVSQPACIPYTVTHLTSSTYTYGGRVCLRLRWILPPPPQPTANKVVKRMHHFPSLS